MTVEEFASSLSEELGYDEEAEGEEEDDEDEDT